MPTPTDPESELVAALFHELVEVNAGDRAGIYRDRAVPESVRIEVEALLGEEPLAAFCDDLVEAAGRRVADYLQHDGPAIDWQAGTKIGDYEIVREIARGGMGVVFEARQLSLGRHVALKVIRDSRFAGSADRQRFHAEAEAIARLDHSGILPVYEVAEHEGLPFFSMAYVAGGSLRDLPRPVAPERAAELLAKVCDAVHYAHSQNIVHRDLKPANVLLTDSLEPRVTDFGLAKDTSEASDLTHTGAILGTPGFMAPEQAGGQQDAVSHLADVYGLGAVLFWLLTGRAPIEGQNLADTLHRVLHEDAPDPRSLAPSVPADLAGICRKALEKAPVQRYSSAAGLAADLRRFLAGEPTAARPLNGRERVWRWCRRKPALATLSVLTALAIGGGIGASTWFAIEASDRAAELATANDKLASANTDLEEQNEKLAIARDEAEKAQGDAKAFSAFLVEDVIQAARPRTMGGGLGSDVTVRDALIAAIPKLDQRFEGRPVAGAYARFELAVTLRYVDRPEIAREQLRLVHETRKRELGPNAQETLSALNSYGVACYQHYDTEAAVAVFEELVERTRAHYPELLARALRNLGLNYERLKRYEDQAALFHEALPLTAAEHRPRVLAEVAVVYARLGKEEEARGFIARARQELAEQPDATDYNRLHTETEVMECIRSLGDDAELVELLPRLLQLSIQVHGRNDATTLNIRRKLAGAYKRTDRPLEAAELLIEELATYGDTVTKQKLFPLLSAAELMLKADKPDRARALAASLYEAIVELEHQGLGPESAAAFQAEVVWCEALLRLGHKEEARKLLLRIPKLRTKVEQLRQQGNQESVLYSVLAKFEQLAEKLR